MLAYETSGEESPQLPLQDYDEVLMYGNFASTIGETVYNFMRSRLDDGIHLPGKTIPVRYLETFRDAAETAESLKNNIDPDKNVILGYAGGDGTGLQLIQPLSRGGYDNVALWASGGGSGGNTQKSTITKDYRPYPDYVIENGHIEAFRPIQCSFTLPDGVNFDIFAASIVGIGATRDIIYPINHESHRSRSLRRLHIGTFALGKYFADTPGMIAGLSRSEAFVVKEETDNFTVAHERAYINMPRIAEIIFAPEVTVSGPVHKITATTKFDIVKAVAQLRRGNSPGHDLHAPDKFTVYGNLAMQIDGDDSIEDSRLPLPEHQDDDGNNRKLLIFPDGTKIEVKQAEKSFKIVTTMPHI